jgi:hypothetical protein
LKLDNKIILSSMIPLRAHSSIEGMAYAPNGKLLACRGANLPDGIWDIAEKEFVPLLPTLTQSPWKDMAFSGDGSLFATLHEDGRLCLHRVKI